MPFSQTSTTKQAVKPYWSISYHIVSILHVVSCAVVFTWNWNLLNSAPNQTRAFIMLHNEGELNCMFVFSFVASERAHWVTPQAARLPPGPPWKEKEEGEPWGPWAVPQSQEADRAEGQTVPQTETCREDPDEEDVSIDWERLGFYLELLANNLI